MIYEIISGIQYLHNIRTDQRAIHGDLKVSCLLYYQTLFFIFSYTALKCFNLFCFFSKQSLPL